MNPTAHFGVLTEPWIPYVTPDGAHHEGGILEVLENAHSIASLEGANVMEIFGLYRFLTLFLADALRPQSVTELAALLARGSIGMSSINAYVDECKAAGVTFDLFDKERPFLQTPYDSKYDKDAKPACLLDYSKPVLNGHIHFSHMFARDIAYTPAQTARFLAPLQLFAVAMVHGVPSTPSGAPPYYALLDGRSLFETLILSLPIPPEDAFSEPVFWRMTQTVVPSEGRPEASWAQLMLFPARRVCLIPSDDGLVHETYLQAGWDFKDPAAWKDPQVLYRKDSKGNIYTCKPKRGMSFWTIIKGLLDPALRPPVLTQWLESDIVRFNVCTYGIETMQAQRIAQLEDSFTVPHKLLADEQLAQEALKVATTGEEAWRHFSTVFDGIPGGENMIQYARERFGIQTRAFLPEMLRTFANAPDADDARSIWNKRIAHAEQQTIEAALDAYAPFGKNLILVEKRRYRNATEDAQ